MKIKTLLLTVNCEERDDYEVTEIINRALEEHNITSDTLIDVKFNTHSRNVPEIPIGDSDIYGAAVDGYIYQVAILIIYKANEIGSETNV